MKPLTTDTLPPFLNTPRQILILDVGAVSLQLVQSAVERSVINVTTKGGLWLPAELWDIVFRFGAASPPSCKLELVKITTGHPLSTPQGHVIHINAVALTQIRPYEIFNSQVDIWRALEFIDCDESEWPEIGKSRAFTLRWNAERELPTYAVTIPDAPRDGRVIAPRPQILYQGVSLADVIAKVQGGRCGKCDNRRFICSCLGKARSNGACCGPPFAYDGSTLAYCMDVPCPVCLGLNVFAIWETTLSRGFRRKLKESAAYLSRILDERLEELRYPTSLRKTPEQLRAEYQGYLTWKRMMKQQDRDS